MPFYHTQNKVPDEWHNPEVVNTINAALELKGALNKIFDGNTWEVNVTASVDTKSFSLLKVREKYFISNKVIFQNCERLNFFLLIYRNCNLRQNRQTRNCVKFYKFPP